MLQNKNRSGTYKKGEFEGVVIFRSVPLDVRVSELTTYNYHDKLKILKQEYPRIRVQYMEQRIIHEERRRDWRYDYQ